MVNRRFFRIIALLLVTMICLTACSQNMDSDPQKTEPVIKNKVEKVMFERIWKHDEVQDRDMEYAIILGLDTNGDSVWSHVTDEYPVAQDDVVAEVLSTQSQYIFCEDGTLISLDISTGEVLWENREFGGYGVRGVEADNGNLYFCGYLGTSFFAVDENGNTLHKIESFGADYDWAHDIRFEGDKIAVTLGLGPEELRGPKGFVILVDPNDYSFALQSTEIPEAVVAPVVLPALAGEIAQVLPLYSGAVAVLYTDGTVGVAGNDELAAKAASWKNVVQLYWGAQPGNIAALMADGTAVSTEYDLSNWSNLKELYANYEGIAGLREDGRVVGAGYWEYSMIEDWTDIRDFGMGDFACFGLKKDGSVVCTDEAYYETVCSQKNVQRLLLSSEAYAILEDGRIVSDVCSEAELENLQDAVKLMGDGGWLFGLSADGQLLARTVNESWVYNNGDCFTAFPLENREEYPNIYIHDGRFRNIKDIYYQNALIMLKYDGTVDTVNVDYYWDLSQWERIEKVVTAYADDYAQPRLYGIRADGSVITAKGSCMQASDSMDDYLGWRVLDLYNEQHSVGVVGITPEGTLVGDGDYEDTDFSVLIR